MEVAGQWRREWAGTAEYGKVTEGGVTKRVARAMEVLQASGPGARVRVLRAAYHATAGPGEPASSYMIQSSRRVISSGYNFLEPTSSQSKPLEISSMPLEITDSNVDNQDYKVTEPDDLDISQPSKWRSVSGSNSIRLPSEESSSTDNASIIDLDSKTYPKYSYKKEVIENSHQQSESFKPGNPKNNRVSPLLDAPVTLSTLKYKSLLNGNDDWNNRRKSYSFEDTAPLSKIILDRNDRFAIESSTDSGICKSSEIVNDTDNTRYYKSKERKSQAPEETFKDWLTKNRQNTFGSHPTKPLKEHSITPERLSENNITLQSPGKMCITLPVTIETDDDDKFRKNQICNEADKKSKKVEFCKTELHFTTETGTVNIIATDEKPPPTNDFRRRRSAFVPISDRFEKPVMLFGEKTDFNEKNKTECFSNSSTSEIGESDENTAATKSILKNRIPKPKPYLLGENMVLGNVDNLINKSDKPVVNDQNVTGVSLINTQLQADRKFISGIKSHSPTKFHLGAFTHNSYRTSNEGSLRQSSYKNNENITPEKRRSNSRQLKDSDLMYFGIEKSSELMSKQPQDNNLYDNNRAQEEIFESVRLVQKVSNSVCSSEVESDEAPEYINLVSKVNYTPVPAPRIRIKYCEKNREPKISGNLNSISEQEKDDNISETQRRSRLRRQDLSYTSNRSISEPPKIRRARYKEQDSCQKNASNNSTSHRTKCGITDPNRDLKGESDHITKSKDSTSIYVNLRAKEIKDFESRRSHYKTDSKQNPHTEKDTSLQTKERNIGRTKAQKNSKNDEDSNKIRVRRSDSLNTNSNDNTLKSHTKTRKQRTEKLVTPELSHTRSRVENEKLKEGSNKIPSEHKEKDNRTRSLCRHTTPDSINVLKEAKSMKEEPKRQRNSRDFEEKYIHPQINITNLSTDSRKSHPDLDLNSSSKVKQNKILDKKYHDSNKSKRSKYVINYDDKNGTVSSVRKIKPYKHADHKNYSTKDNKENSNEQKVRIKQLNKIALQKFSPDQQKYQYGKDKDRVSKSKAHKRSCQLL
ncbi:unnamed protein product [Parnassius apollo]|uniref:(apollo) hypothetical protein n=1 Tax=Parnassius apollo TaxID=110799 RepID=A0A8S3XCZ3_PARAO|nr:unnamed protein product [Parnassius apollo]